MNKTIAQDRSRSSYALFFKFCSGALLLCSYLPLSAHEFWFEPTINTSRKTIELQAFQGEGLLGNPVKVKEHKNDDWKIKVGNKEVKPLGPSFNTLGTVTHKVEQKPDENVFIFYQSPPAITSYKTFEAFATFLKAEGLDEIAQLHVERDLPRNHFNEVFFRHTKNLICGESVSIKDTDSPASYEWIIQEITEKPSVDKNTAHHLQVLTLQLNHLNQPMIKQPAQIFSRTPSGDYQHKQSVTDALGNIYVDYVSGSELLISSTLIKKPDTKTMIETSAIWESHWVAYRMNTSEHCFKPQTG